MARRCDLTGKGVLTGNLVSHSNRKTRTRFLPNIQSFTMRSDILNKNYRLSLCVSTVRTIEAKGGFDKYLIDTANRHLTPIAKSIKKDILKALSEIQTA